MTVQTSVTTAPAIGVPGMLVNGDGPTRIESKVAGTAIPFGAWVCFLTDGAAVVPAATGNVSGFQGGIALIDHNKPTTTGYVVGDVVRVLTLGHAYALTEEALALGDTVFVRFGDGGGGTVEGSFRNDADTATAVAPQVAVRVAVPGASNLAILKVGA